MTGCGCVAPSAEAGADVEAMIAPGGEWRGGGKTRCLTRRGEARRIEKGTLSYTALQEDGPSTPGRFGQSVQNASCLLVCSRVGRCDGVFCV